MMLKNIKNLLPYFILVAIYFFFINLEARRDKNNQQNEEFKNLPSDNNTSFDETKLRITIPVIPYKQ